jgi:methylglyoxal synthase
MNIALIAHDKRKELLVQFCVANCGILARHKLCATGTTGKLVADATGLDILRFMNGIHGGVQQVAARIANNEVDMLFFFRDPSLMNSESVDGTTLLRLCDVHNIPVATNITTAELLVKALERGDFDWKEPIITPSKRKKNIY